MRANCEEADKIAGGNKCRSCDRKDGTEKTSKSASCGLGIARIMTYTEFCVPRDLFVEAVGKKDRQICARIDFCLFCFEDCVKMLLQRKVKRDVTVLRLPSCCLVALGNKCEETN